MTSMSSKHKSAIWSHDTGQRIHCFDRCELNIIWMPNIKDAQSPREKLQLRAGLLRSISVTFHIDLHEGAYGGTISVNSWFSHDVTKIRTTKLLIFLRFYFNDV